jgi:hypothetical protein
MECSAVRGWWLHLRRCVECRHSGCCDPSPNQHTSKHNAATGYPIITSFEPGERWFYDYRTGEFFGLPEASRPSLAPVGSTCAPTGRSGAEGFRTTAPVSSSQMGPSSEILHTKPTCAWVNDLPGRCRRPAGQPCPIKRSKASLRQHFRLLLPAFRPTRSALRVRPSSAQASRPSTSGRRGQCRCRAAADRAHRG